MPIADWFLSADERGNPATRLDSRHPDGRAWTCGNTVTPLVHGATYFAELDRRVRQMGDGDLLLFTDWRGDADQQLLGKDGSEVATLLGDAARRGVDVRGLVWRSHWKRLSFAAEANRTLGDLVNEAGGQCQLDMRVRPGGSHHQKLVVLRHPGRPELDVAFVGGLDLCHSRRDDADHAGDPQRQPMAKVYGERPPWHDVQVALTGPVVGDVETVFRERWEDPQPLSRSPLRRAQDRVRGVQPDRVTPLPEQLPDPEPTGELAVQLLRTYPFRRPGYPFAPQGECSVARGYRKALGQARRLVYVEDQYLWSTEVARLLARTLRANPELHLVAVLPHHPDQDGRLAVAPQLLGRQTALRILQRAAPGRVTAYGVESPAGVPVYVHAKVCVIDDTWASVGSDNFNRRSWTHDSEIAAAVHDPGGYPQRLRLALAAEHLDLEDASALADPAETLAAFARSAQCLQAWHDGGRVGPRPPGRLRPLTEHHVSGWTRVWAGVFYRLVHDPDGRSWRQRLRRAD
ncbi:MAG: phospholipase D-like domain-containing protein [Oryzihumus sp.]